MNAKSLLILLVLLLAGAAAYLVSTGESKINSAESIGSPILPGLYEALNEVDELHFTGADSKVVTTLKRAEENWVVGERSGYPADIAKIRSVVLALAEAKIMEQKTSNKELYSKLGVESVDQNDASGVQVSVHYGDHVQALIVGKPGPQINKNRYVRRADDAASWLVDKKLDVQYDVTHWLRKDILSVEPGEVAAVTIMLSDGSNIDIKNDNSEDNNFIVTNLTDPSSQVIDAELHQVTNALSSFQLLDVMDEEKFSEHESTMVVVYQLKSGASIKFTGYEVDKDHFVSVDVDMSDSSEDSPAEQDVQTFVRELQERTMGWVFKIPNVSYDSMYKREENVLAITVDQLN